ncbi:kinase-like domain-containing protein, partial [Thamnocephalis sphaerospora]
GNCIGKGQFGSVYRALNLETGQMVAIKRVYILDKDEKEVESLMQEVALLEKLAHHNVVKYEGFIKGDGFLNIVLEYIENGSLLTTLKSFGVFPERLVASYTVKILEGLVYLHDQDVAHCDLKAANLLTTKDGNVKLSDFGVSLNLQLVE